MEFLKNHKDFFKVPRLDTALNEILSDAREFPDKIDMQAKFELTQPRHIVQRRNVNLDYEAREDPIEDATLKYKAKFYFFILDKAINPGIQLIRSVQTQSFTDKKLISNLSVFRDDSNIIRVKTQITERTDAPNILSPILPPNNCIFTQRLIEHFHLKNNHAGTQLLLSIKREEYWIVGGRRTVRNIWNACVKCRRFKSKSPMTDLASLPSNRVKDAAVYEVVGADLTGLLYVKRGDKVWIVLYICAIYHRLHLELVSVLSTDAFLLSFRRFVVRRGRSRIIYSDNGTNFRGTYNKLVCIDWNEVSRYVEIQRITWKCIPPTAAW
ncbi:integrase catalytic domain-containing protein [Trichonephila clavipes]|uniref:Integrase catalytic domain-containing protein n=1 Tax=Trichonephila clavipes TaxID=2585209 RepID=A0A8X7BDJ6_TRICX|nr:integrase catalytic domain-containing protein [Trichonephila clavipes]